MNFCAKCGNEGKRNDAFCVQCGAKLGPKTFADPTKLPELDRRTLDNLKIGKRVRRFLCLECGYSGPATLVRKKYNWIAIGATFALSMVIVLVSGVSGSGLAFLCVIVLVMTTSYTIRCPRCENESFRKGFNAYR